MKIQTVHSLDLHCTSSKGHGKCNKVALGKNTIPTLFTVTMRYLKMEKQQ